MIELFPEGFEEVPVESGVELAAYTRAGGEERVWHVFGPGQAEDVPSGWLLAWRTFHRPVRVGPLWIGPPWEEPDRDAIAVVVDPGQAFGTGAHPTTRLCLELLLELSPTAGDDAAGGGSVVDLGCGSGVLALAAAKLGFAPVCALDLDEAAVQATRAGSQANAVEVDVRRADLLVDPLPAADLALANIALEPVERVGARVESRRLITSGYLASETPALPGWDHRRRREAGGWAADLFERSAGAGSGKSRAREGLR